jgi:uncharacterized repeat protein (TIGR02543 family)
VSIAYNEKLEVGTGAFNLEMWVKETSRVGYVDSNRVGQDQQYTASFWSSSVQKTYEQRSTAPSSFMWGLTFDGPSFYSSWNANQNRFYPAGKGTGYTDALTSNTKTASQTYLTFTDHAWHHIALSKTAVGGTLSMYLDGVRVLYVPNENNTYSLLGGSVIIGGQKFVGQIGDVRLVKGQALYTGPSITVPTSQITTTSQGAVASNVSLLLKAGGGNCAIEDFSDNHFPVLINGATCSNAVARAITSYNLQFDKQGHGTQPADQGNITSIAVGSLPVIANDGYFSFQGWATTPSGPVLTGTYTAVADSTLYAVWQDNSPGMRSTTYNLGGGSGTLPRQATVSEGTSYSTASSSGLTRAGYTFNKWNDGTTDYSAGASYTVSTSNVTLTATWTANPTRTITYNLGGGSGTLPTQVAVSEGASFLIATSSGLSRAGYTFNKWNDGSADYSPGASYTLSTSDVTLTATWTANPTHTTTYNLGGGSGTLPTQATVSEGVSFNTASSSGITRVGYTFNKWNDGTADYATGASYTMSTSNVTLTATWTAKSTSRTIVFPTTSYSLNYGSTQTVAATVSARANIPTITFNGNNLTNTNPRLTTGINGNQGVNGNFFGYAIEQGSFTEGQIVTMSDLSAGSTVTYSGKLHFLYAGGFGWAFFIIDILSVTGSSANVSSSNWLLTGEGAITYSAGASTACSVDRWTGEVTITSGTGTCEISSTVVEDSEYQALTTTVPVSITVNKIAQSTLSLSLSSSSKSSPFTQAVTFTPNGGTGSGLISYAVVAGGTALGCSLANTSSSNTISATSAGTCLIKATKAGDSNYSETISAAETFTFNTSNQATALVITSTSGTYGTDVSLISSGGSGLGDVTFATTSAGCSLPTATTLRATAPVTCQVTATKAADVDYNAAVSVLTNVVFAPKAITITGLIGINKEFDGGVTATVSGSPTVSGKIDGDTVTLLGTPTFAFATAGVANTKIVTASGYTLTGADSAKYVLTQPTVTANITKKNATVTAASTAIAVGSPYTPAFSSSGLVGSDSIILITYSFSSTGTGTPPITAGSSVITPSAAVFGVLGAGDNYTISYITGTLDISASFQVSFKSNFTSSDNTTAIVNFTIGDSPISPVTPTRNNFTFLGWYTSAVGGNKITGAISPTADTVYWAHWIQNSLNGMGSANKIGTFTTDSQYLDTFTRSGEYGTVTISIPAGALPNQTLVDIYQVTDPARANALLAGSNYVLSLVVAWLAPDATVPTTQPGKPVAMTISNATIKKGAKIYAIINDVATLLGTAAQDGSARVLITDDPEVVIVTTKPDAPTGVSATTGGKATTTVSWTAPSDGGSDITKYFVTDGAGKSCETVTTSCTITGLSEGTSYTFTVTASNAIGSSPASAPSAAIVTENTTALALAAQQAAAAALAAQQAAAALAAQQAAAALAAQQAADALAAQQAAAALAAQQAAAALAAQQAAAAAQKEVADKAAAELKASQDRAAAETAAAAAIKAAQDLATAQAQAAAQLQAAQAKAAADARAAAELKASQDRAAAEAQAAAAIKAAQDLADAQAKAAAELKAAQEKAAEEARIAAELKAAQEKADAELKAAAAAKAIQDAADAAALVAEKARIAAELKAAQEKADADLKAAAEAKALQDAKAAAALAAKKIVPKVTLYSISSKLTLSAYDNAYLKKYISTLKSKAPVTCVGYYYSKNTTIAKAKALATTQAKAICAMIKKAKPTVVTSVVLYPSTKAPLAAKGAQWVAVSYRVDSFKN